MKIFFYALTYFAVFAPFANAKLCFDATATAATRAVEAKLGKHIASRTDLNIKTINNHLSYATRRHGDSKATQGYNTWSAVGTAYVGGFQPGGEIIDFNVVVYTKSGTCEILEVFANVSDTGHILK